MTEVREPSEREATQDMPEGLALRVVKGHHKGALTALAASDIVVIGSSDDCDVILADDGVAGHHCCATRQDGRLVLRAIDGDLLLNSRRYGRGTTVQLSPRATFGIGEAKIEVVAAAPGEPTHFVTHETPVTFLRKFRWTIGASLAVLVVVACALNPDFRVGAKPTVAAPPPRPVERPGYAVAHDVAEVLRLSGVASDARYTGNGAVTVSGHLGDPKSLESIIQSRAMHDIVGLKRVVAVNLDSAQKPVPEEAKRIVSIVNASDPYIVAADGSRYYVGASLPEGGRLSGVMTGEHGTAEALIERDGQIEHLKLARAGTGRAGHNGNSVEE
jgi:hypothetical protein